MGGSAIGGNNGGFSGVRVSSQPVYTPAYFIGNKRTSQCIRFRVVQNSTQGTDARTGEKGRKDVFRIVAWGPLADVLAKSLCPGKEVGFAVEGESYEGLAYSEQGEALYTKAGVHGKVLKHNNRITKLWGLGDDSEKRIAFEKANPVQDLFNWRPANWDQPGTDGPNLWRQVCMQRNAYKWDGRSPVFGHAKVNFAAIPRGAQIDLSTAAERRAAGAPAETSEANFQSFQQNVQQAANQPYQPQQQGGAMFNAGTQPPQNLAPQQQSGVMFNAGSQPQPGQQPQQPAPVWNSQYPQANVTSM